MQIGRWEIGRVLHFKSEIRNLELDSKLPSRYVRFEISDFGFEMQDSSNFKISRALHLTRNALLILLLLLLPACGKVGDPLPPFIRIPEAVKDLAVTQNGYDLVLSWTNPPRYIDGSAATNLSVVHIRKNGETLATVKIEAAGQPQSYPTPVGAVLAGQSTFSLVVETTQGKFSQVSNTASVTPVEVPGRITGLSARPDQRRIFLSWEKPQDHPELADLYVVTRTDIPAEVETVNDTRYEDVRYRAGRALTYRVTAGRRVAGNVVMGVGPESTTVTAEDKTPPAVPVGLEVKASEAGAYVAWEPNSESDLAGYRVFRSEWPDSGFKPVTDRLTSGVGFFDSSYTPGLYYAVSAVDESGNESAMSPAFRGP
jgi:hypothetical protein